MANRYENRKDIKTSNIYTHIDALWWSYTYIIDTKYETSFTFILSKRKRTIINRTSIQYIKSVEPKVMTIMIMIITIYTESKKGKRLWKARRYTIRYDRKTA
jgi:hypothetical protein